MGRTVVVAFVVAVQLAAAACTSSSPGGASSEPSPTPTAEPTPIAPELEVRFLGVGGFYLRVGDDAVLTAPFFTNPSMAEVTVGSVSSNHALVDQFLGEIPKTKAILSGHAHYDHLLDVPYAWTKTNGATIYGNRSAKHLLAGYAPDDQLAEGCPASPSDAAWSRVPREKVVALDDPMNDVVDWRSCAGVESCGTTHTGEGAWVAVPESHVRIRALCSKHPDQIFIVHFGEGCMAEDECKPLTRMSDWKEGNTLAFLVDFLDPETGAPRFRVYYQDAPFDAPVSHPHPELLAEKRVDLAIVNGGNYEQVDDHPQPILGALDPRFAILGHWEDFFRTQDQPLQPLPFLSTELLDARMAEALPAAPGETRHWIPEPGDQLALKSE